MKAILMSIRPQWVVKILNGKKTLEIRKTMPKCNLPIDVYIYCTKDYKDIYRVFNGRYYRLVASNLSKKENAEDESSINGQVVAKFTLNKVEELAKEDYYPNDDLMSATMWYEWHTKTMDEDTILEKSCLSQSEISNYLKLKYGYAWHIDNLEIFGKPKELSSFFVKSHKVKGIDRNGKDKDFIVLKPLTKPFQSWGYIEV